MLLTAAALVFACPQATQGDFTIAVLPDTQYYCRDEPYFPTFVAQVQTILAQRSNLQIAFVTHVGDIVHNGASIPAQWVRADQALSPLRTATGLAHSVALGNHDLDVINEKTLGEQTYLTWFGSQQWSGQPWYLGASPKGTSHAQRFVAGGQEYLHLTVEWRAHDSEIEWARSVLQAQPQLPTILTTHEYLNVGNPAPYGTGGATPDTAGDNDAAQIRAKLVEPYPQVFLVLSGHFSGSGQRSAVNAFGQVVHEVLQDFQSDPAGGNGWMRWLHVRPAAQELVFDTHSPTYQPGVSVGPDRNATPEDNFTLSYDLVALADKLRSSTTLRFGNSIDTHLGNGSAGQTLPTVSYGSAVGVRCDGDADQEQGLLRFEGLVGFGPQQIPPQTPIERAVLVLTTEGANANSNTGAALHRILIPWDTNSTWQSLNGGVQLGTEAASSADLLTGSVAKGTRSFDVTNSLQAWVNGAPNYGWLLQATGTDRWEVRSNEWPQAAERPMLVVRFANCSTPQSYCISAPNSFSTGAVISHLGSTSLTNNDLRLLVDFAPPGRKGLYFVGTQAASVPFGDGWRCVGGAMTRLGPVQIANFIGSFERQVDWTVAPFQGTVSPGAVRYFQLQYRDPTGPGGAGTGAGFNLSNGLRVVICP